MLREINRKQNGMDPFQTLDKAHKIRLVSLDSRYKGGFLDQGRNSHQSTFTEIILSEDGVFTYKKSPDSITGWVEISEQEFQNDGRWEVSGKDEFHTTLNLFFRDGRQLSYQVAQDQKGYLFLDGKRYTLERLK